MSVFISRYVHRFHFYGYITYYHSLRMKPVFLTVDEAMQLERDLRDGKRPELSDEILHELSEYMILVETDEGVLEYVQKHVPKPYISLAYFVLSEQCNLACKYCFLGNADIKAPKITNYPMSKETADKALEFFSRQTMEDRRQFYDEKEIIFYGGEPLMNFQVLRYVVERSEYYKKQNMISKNLKFSIITNGTLLNEEIIRYLKDNQISVSISLDGNDEFKNRNRVDKKGQNVFLRIMDKLLLAKRMGLRFGLSITLSEETIKDIGALIHMIDELDIDSVCFNILLKTKNYDIDTNYYIDATNFIIEFYKKTKSKNIYEDRFARKLKAFADSGIYFSDCAATAGSQIVITPDGQVGICHGTTECREAFFGNVWDEDLVAANNEEVIRWSKRIPIFREDCIICPALGICGGGCPINARAFDENRSLEALDKAFCVHAKRILEFLLEELLKYTLEERIK